MAGYNICSLDAQVFRQLTTAPTMEQCLLLADAVLDGLDEAIDEYGDDFAADPDKWPMDREELAKSIQRRLGSADWYADLTFGDACIWDRNVLGALMGEVGLQMGVDFQCENDCFLYWDAAELAAKHGATMMAEPMFGNSGFRYSGKSQTELELSYAVCLPAEVRDLQGQLEKAAAYFEALPDEEDDGNRAQFFEGLLEPVRRIAEAGRVMWVQTDT